MGCAGEDVNGYGEQLEWREEKAQTIYYKSHHGVFNIYKSIHYVYMHKTFLTQYLQRMS